MQAGEHLQMDFELHFPSHLQLSPYLGHRSMGRGALMRLSTVSVPQSMGLLAQITNHNCLTKLE